MKKFLLIQLVAAGLLAGCVVWPGPPGSGGVLVVPPLPSIVVLEVEPYYHYGGYFYFYQGSRWSYSKSRSGPWVELPRDRYPKEVRFKDQGKKRGKGNKGGHGKGKRN